MLLRRYPLLDGPSAVTASRNTPYVKPSREALASEAVTPSVSRHPLLFYIRVASGDFFGERTKDSAPIPVSVALQRVVHSPAFGALQPADQMTGFALAKCTARHRHCW